MLDRMYMLFVSEHPMIARTPIRGVVLSRLFRSQTEGGCCHPVNLGTGKGVSVLDLVKGMEAATGKSIPFKITARRPGDVAR